MKKYISALLLSSVLTLSLSAAASAEISPYVSAKYAYTHIRNDAKSTVDTDIPSLGSAHNTIVDKDLTDNKSGVRLAVGATVPVDAIWGDIRGEIEFAYNAAAKNKGNATFDWGDGAGGHDIAFKNRLETKAVFLNAYYDIETCTDFIPYVGGGIGYGMLKNKARLLTDSESGKDREENFAWNVGLGIGYIVTENITLDLGYRYTDFGSIKNSARSEVPNVSGSTMHSRAKYDVTSHEVSLGLRYNF